MTSLAATLIFVVGVIAGYRYRRNWVAEGPRRKGWIYGLTAAVALLIVALVPLRGG